MNLHDIIQQGDAGRLRKAAADGADMNSSFPESDECLLSIAAAKGDPKLVKLLLTLGADPDNRKTITPPLAAAAASGSVESVRAIIDAGAEIDALDEDGATPLMIAAIGGQTGVVQELLKHGANPKVKDRFGNSPVYCAALKGCSDLLDVLMPLSAPKEQQKSAIALEHGLQKGNDQQVFELIHKAGTLGDFEVLRSFSSSQ